MKSSCHCWRRGVLYRTTPLVVPILVRRLNGGVKFLEASVKIREMEAKDLEAVSTICMDSFSKSVAGTLSEEGISTFSKIASSASFLNRMKEDNVILVAERHGRIEGVIELKEGRHIAMLFVEPENQKKGVGKKLLSAALSYARVETVTVSAALSSVPVYENCGFECKGDISESAGLVYQPMAIELNKTLRTDAAEPRR